MTKELVSGPVERDPKRFSDGPKFFIYAPPIKGRRNKAGELISKRKLPNPPFRGAETWQCSVYYFWWEYLRRHDGYARACKAGGKGKFAKLYADFGDVTASDDFMGWWNDHRQLFWEPPARKIEEKSLLNTQVDADMLYLAIPLEARTAYLVRMFRDLLRRNADKVHTARVKSRADYPVHAKPSLQALYASITAWDLRKAHPNAKLYELFDLVAAKTQMAVDERVTIAGDDGDKPYVVDLKKTEREAKRTGVVDVFLREARKVVRRRKAQTINRHLKTADAYIENVGKGQFPKK